MLRSFLYACCVAGLAGSALTPAHAEAGDILIRLRAIAVDPTGGSTAIEPGFPTEKVKVSTGWAPELDFTYMITRNVGVELIAGTTRHTARGQTGITGAIGPLVRTWVLPPTVTLQYHVAPDAAIRPYVGAGVNWTLFYSSKATKELEDAVGKTHVGMSNSWGWALQAGVDIPVSERMFVNFDVKYIDIHSKAKLSTTALGLHGVRLNIDPLVFGAGIGMRF